MIFPKDWPFKGKPNTNSYIKISIGIVSEIAWLVAMFTFPAPTFVLTMLFCLFLCVRAIYRTIAPEWKKNAD